MTTTPAPPSPSPPPQKPTATTPGVRATAFTKLYNDALASTIRAISYENFADCFPLIAKQAPGSLRHMHGNFISRLEGFAKEEFQTILHERSVIENLNKLEDLIRDAQKRKARAADSTAPPTPPHTLPAPSILTAHKTPHLSSQQSQLNAKIQTLQSQNASLFETIGQQKKEVEELLGVVERVLGDLEKAGTEVGARGEELAAEARGAEGLVIGKV